MENVTTKTEFFRLSFRLSSIKKEQNMNDYGYSVEFVCPTNIKIF